MAANRSPRSLSRHAPRRRGIRYAVTFVKVARPALTDRPPTRTMPSSYALDLTVDGPRRARRPTIACDHEQRADDREILQRIHQGLGAFRRRLIPEIMEIEGHRGHEEDQENGKEPRAEIQRDHQSADDLEGPDRNGEHL